MYQYEKTGEKKKRIAQKRFSLKWTSLGLNQGPPDYESVALTN